MANLKTNYMGLELKNPIIVGASNLVTEHENLRKIEEAGAGAIVYKSLFEEQIQLEDLEFSEHLEEYSEREAEMRSIFPDIEHAGPAEFLMNLKNAKEAVSIPMIASLNAVNHENWVEYARKIEETGVDGLELNFYTVPYDFDVMDRAVINEQLDILRSVTNEVSIPISVKLSSYYTNPLYVIREMDKIGVKAFVLFNRLFQPAIDIDTEEHFFPYNLSNPEDSRLPLRFAGLLYGELDAQICSSSGIFTGHDVISMLLSGADSVQVVSALYRNKISVISKMLEELESWMNKKKYNSIDEFRGKLSRKNLKDPFAYKRAQYVDILMKSKEIFKRYPQI